MVAQQERPNVVYETRAVRPDQTKELGQAGFRVTAAYMLDPKTQVIIMRRP